MWVHYNGYDAFQMHFDQIGFISPKSVFFCVRSFVHSLHYLDEQTCNPFFPTTKQFFFFVFSTEFKFIDWILKPYFLYMNIARRALSFMYYPLDLATWWLRWISACVYDLFVFSSFSYAGFFFYVENITMCTYIEHKRHFFFLQREKQNILQNDAVGEVRCCWTFFIIARKWKPN